ncbi:hypothetical protein [Streptomyces sp. NPDC001348]
MKLARLGSVVAMGVAAVGFAAGTANASGLIYSADGAASVGYDSSTEYWTICDEKADGHAAVGRMYYQGHLYTTVWNKNGAHSCVTSRDEAWMPDGASIRLEACVGNAGKVKESSCVSRPDKA